MQVCWEVVKLTHDGGKGQTNYYHLEEVSVAKGADVDPGDKIGTSDNSGCESGPPPALRVPIQQSKKGSVVSHFEANSYRYKNSNPGPVTVTALPAGIKSSNRRH